MTRDKNRYVGVEKSWLWKRGEATVVSFVRYRARFNLELLAAFDCFMYILTTKIGSTQ